MSDPIPPPGPADIARQFGEHAREYAMSRSHNEGHTRLLLLEHMQPVMDETMLDVASGPAPLGLAFAPYVARVIALDLAPPMLHAARLTARRTEVANLGVVAGDAHRLPFRDRSLDLVGSRAAPHHFAEFDRAVAEMARVLRRGGRLGIADGTVPDDPELDTFINALDALHDPTTVRNHSPGEWRSALERAGLRLDFIEEQAYDLAEGRSLTEWMARSGAASGVLAEAKRMLLTAPKRVKDYLRVRTAGDDLTFDLPKIVLTAMKTE